MKSVLFAIDVVNDLLVVLMEDKLEGEIFIQQKPDEYKGKEYIVINSLPVGKDILQTTTVNVNIHVKDILPSKPDHKRLEELTAIVLDGIGEGYNTGNENVAVFDQSIERNEVGQGSYSNIRLRVSMLNQ